MFQEAFSLADIRHKMGGSLPVTNYSTMSRVWPFFVWLDANMSVSLSLIQRDLRGDFLAQIKDKDKEVVPY